MRSIATGTDRFAEALDQLAGLRCRPEFTLQEAPAPQRLAPSTVAMTAEMADPDSDLASGRFVLLHDPDGVEEWGGSFRAVVFVRATLEPDLLDDPLLHDVGWSWVSEILDLRGCHATQVGGTVTRTSGRSFGTMADRPADGYVEIRASWTPVEDDNGDLLDHVSAHAEAWLELMAQAAGLPPIPEGVPVMDQRRRSRS